MKIISACVAEWLERWICVWEATGSKPGGANFFFSCNYIEFDICFKTLFLKISLFMVQHYSSGCIRLCTGTNVLPVPYNIGNIVKNFSCIWIGFFIHFLEGQNFFWKSEFLWCRIVHLDAIGYVLVQKVLCGPYNTGNIAAKISFFNIEIPIGLENVEIFGGNHTFYVKKIVHLGGRCKSFVRPI